jgi:uncharacterized membrane protein
MDMETVGNPTLQLCAIQVVAGEAAGAGGRCETICGSLPGDPCRDYPERFPVSRPRRQELFTSQVGDMLGAVRLAPAILFYLLYVVGILIFVSGSPDATWQSTLLYGALFGLFCYATFDLTSLSLLRHWTWPVAIVDVSWGSFVTAVSTTRGLIIANWIERKL